MQIIPATDRIDALREIYRKEPVWVDHVIYDRERRQRLNYMRAYVNDKTSYTARLRAARAEAQTLRDMVPVIHDKELIVGLPDYGKMTEEEQREYDELSQKMAACPKVGGLLGHKVLDWPKLLKVGVDGLIEECERHLAEIDFNDEDSTRKEEFYTGCIEELQALLFLAEKYAKHARALAGTATPQRARELLEIADILDRVPKRPAETFREALQSIHFYAFALWDLYYYGRMDQYLLPYYRADIAAGRLTPEFAQELIDCFAKLPEAYIVWESSKGTLLGGRDRDGNAIENELTWMLMTSIEHTKTATFTVGLAVTKETSDDILRYAMLLNSKGYTKPAIFNDDVITQALKDEGFEEHDAHDYSNTGCVEITPNGCSGIYVVSPYHNLALLLLDAMKEDVSSLDELIEQFRRRLSVSIFNGNKQQNRYMLERERNGGEVLRVSCLVNDCLAKGRAVDEGGARYNHTQPNFLGMANVVDSLVAINHLVFIDKQLTMKELNEVLAQNYEGNEALRQQIINRIAHFGTDEKETNDMYVRLADIIKTECHKYRNYRGYRLVPGAFSYLEHARHGLRTPATPDGRYAKYPLASGSSPCQGRETKGPTAAMLSATCWDTKPFLGGIAVNMKFTPNQLSGESQDKMLAFIKAFLARGGFQMQFNAVSRKQLLEARDDPEAHEDLLVRVGGFSAYFTRLTKEMQQEIIDRDEHTI